MYKEQKITVIIPCLNEEQGIERVLTRMPAFVDEVIVVDNGSTDRTSDVARGFGAKVVREDVRGVPEERHAKVAGEVRELGSADGARGEEVTDRIVGERVHGVIQKRGSRRIESASSTSAGR